MLIYQLKKLLSNFFSAKGRRFLFYSLFDKIQQILPYSNLRVIMLKWLGADLKNNVAIHDVILQNSSTNGYRNLKIGHNTTLQQGCLLDLAHKIEIGNNCAISAKVTILTHSNCGEQSKKPLTKYFPAIYKKTTIKDNVWIGACATILPGITIGPMSVVGAGAVVTKDVAKNTVVAGVPAKIIRKLK